MANDHDQLPDDVPDENGPERADYDYPLLSAEDFDGELEALESYAGEETDQPTTGEDAATDFLPYDEAEPDEPGEFDEFDEFDDSDQPDEPVADIEQEQASESEVLEAKVPESGAERDSDAARRADSGGPDQADWDEEDRLRQPRAQTFRRRLRNQVGMLPLALYLLALGAYLVARKQDVGGLPDFSTLVLAEFSVLALGFTSFFHSLLSGRRERGLLFVGVWTWVAAVMLGVLVYGIDSTPDVRKWWPLLVWSLGLALLITYVIERTHDVRLILLSVLVLVAGGTAYWVTSDRITEQWLTTATDYWPLVLSVVGIGLLPLAFRRRVG